jgi:hypothetical protein
MNIQIVYVDLFYDQFCMMSLEYVIDKFYIQGYVPIMDPWIAE